MRTAILLATLTAFLAVGTLQADEGKDRKRGDRPDGDRKAEFLKKFDKDESGGPERRRTCRRPRSVLPSAGAKLVPSERVVHNVVAAISIGLR